MASNVAFEILYREYYVRVFGLCRRLLGSAVSAEDATQEVFMKAYRQFNRYDTSQGFWQWIATIANHHCIDVLRRRSRTQKLFADEPDLIDGAEDLGAPLSRQLMSAQDAQALNQAIGGLPDRYRVPLVLAYFNDYSYEQIAEELEISRNNVGVLLLRAKKQLRDALGEPS